MPQTFAPAGSVLGRISSLIEEINGEKTASAKPKTASEMGTSGQGSKDPGGYGRFGGGPTTHPSGKADAGTQSAPMGARAKENEEDVKRDIPASVDSTSPNSGGDQDSKQYNIGTNQSATGEDPSVEDKYKGDKEDPGTSSPANADDVGEKYGSMRFEPLCKMAYDRMEGVLADIARGVNYSNQPTKQAGDAGLAAQAGYELAAAAGAGTSDMEKMAFVQAMVEQNIIDGRTDADLVGEFLYKYAAETERLSKQANPMEGAMEGPEAGGIPPEAAMAAGAGGPPEMGGVEGGDMGGGAMGGMGGPDMGGGGGGGGGGQEDAVNELANALMELGISPEQLISAIQGGGGGGGGGGAPGGEPSPEGMHGEPDADDAAPKAASARRRIPREDAVALSKMAQAVHHYQRSGRMRIKEAKRGTKQAQDREEVKSYIREVCGLR
jgi:hypothetical protein